MSPRTHVFSEGLYFADLILNGSAALPEAIIAGRPSQVSRAGIRQQEGRCARIVRVDIGQGGLAPPESKGGCHGT